MNEQNLFAVSALASFNKCTQTLTGCNSGVSVVDVDINNVDGRKTVKIIANRYGALPKTITQQTGQVVFIIYSSTR